QQRRPGAACAEEEAATRRGLPRNEIAAQLREAVGAPCPRKGRGGAPLSQAPAQAHGARGLLTPLHRVRFIRGGANVVRSAFALWRYSSALTISSHIFLASPNSIIVLSR